MTTMHGVKLEPYDQGYRDGWHDIHITRRKRRRKRRQRNAEYALGYGHGRTDGDVHPEAPEWWPDYAQGWNSRARLVASESQPAPEAPEVAA